MPTLLAYVLLFTLVGAAFILVNLLVGALVRPMKPDVEKGSVYECGEPTVGTSWIQFDLRLYVVALLFVIFDVETVFMFPWVVIFDKLLLFGLIEMLIFIFILVVGYYYAWQKGALEWV